MARLTLSAGMLAPLADSIAAFSLRLPLGSPPPLRAATVISRRIFENSFPRWTSVLPFFRLICDHRECPDMMTLAFLVGLLPTQGLSELLHALAASPAGGGRPGAGGPAASAAAHPAWPARTAGTAPAACRARGARRSGTPCTRGAPRRCAGPRPAP